MNVYVHMNVDMYMYMCDILFYIFFVCYYCSHRNEKEIEDSVNVMNTNNNMMTEIYRTTRHHFLFFVRTRKKFYIFYKYTYTYTYINTYFYIHSLKRLQIMFILTLIAFLFGFYLFVRHKNNFKQIYSHTYVCTYYKSLRKCIHMYLFLSSTLSIFSL